MVMDATITLIVNGKERTVVTDPGRSLLDVLREDLHLTGAKYGCGEGRCGACTVLMDGRKVLSCVTPVAKADNKKITTIEGLAEGDRLHPVQQAFLDEGAIQCGYCTPGMILAAVALLEKNPQPTDEQIVAWMNGNVCRCNGYTKILNAIRRSAARIAEVKVS
jgi:carbon-monoxide dehydrogenase small subunit